jgi:L-ascorbate metabolism protein UlaG (beta-lactamase superfamily)
MSNKKKEVIIETTSKVVKTGIKIDPVEHASMILNWDGKYIYTDPVNLDLYNGKPASDIILITDIHGDHFDAKALKGIIDQGTTVIAPQAVLDIMPEELKVKVQVIKNGDKKDLLGFSIEAIPMYNLPEGDKAYHIKGRGNGYVIEKGGTRVYVSGDTSGIPEMKGLKNIDMAFIAMNLPYTMDVGEAALSVLAFAPKKVYPYHYRTPKGFSDVVKFKELVNSQNPNIEVVQLDWYSKK